MIYKCTASHKFPVQQLLHVGGSKSQDFNVPKFETYMSFKWMLDQCSI